MSAHRPPRPSTRDSVRFPPKAQSPILLFPAQTAENFGLVGKKPAPGPNRTPTSPPCTTTGRRVGSGNGRRLSRAARSGSGLQLGRRLAIGGELNEKSIVVTRRHRRRRSNRGRHHATKEVPGEAVPREYRAFLSCPGTAPVQSKRSRSTSVGSKFQTPILIASKTEFGTGVLLVRSGKLLGRMTLAQRSVAVKIQGPKDVVQAPSSIWLSKANVN